MKNRLTVAALLLLAVKSFSQCRCALPLINKVQDNSAALPGDTAGQKLESLLFWNQAEKERRFPVMPAIFPSTAVAINNDSKPLKKGKNLKRFSPAYLQKYVAENHIAGLVVLQNDKIRLEKYATGVQPSTVWTSFSVAKSVSSMLVGAALQAGDIKSLEDPLEKYIPEFSGEDYGKVTVRQLLTMTSGIDWNEDYTDAQSDVAQMYRQPCEGAEAHILSYMKKLKRKHPAGTVWNYSTGETDLVGILVQKATGKSLAQYLSEKIWKPFGMESCGFWLEDECSGLNIGGSGLSATVRDFARLGTVMLHKGKINGKPIFAEEYLKNATSLLFATDENGGGYGYLWWHNADGSYGAFGIFGQMIYVNPAKKLVIAQNAAWPVATSKELSARRSEFIKKVISAL